MALNRLATVVAALLAHSSGGSLVGAVCATAMEVARVAGAGLALHGNGHRGPVCTNGVGAAHGEDSRDARIVIDQLQTALNSRIVIEQAKGVVAQQGGIGVDLAFVRMHRFARDRNLSISETARRIVGGQFDFMELPLLT